MHEITKLCEKMVRYCKYFSSRFLSIKLLEFIQIGNRTQIRLIASEKLHRIHIKRNILTVVGKEVIATSPFLLGPTFDLIHKNEKFVKSIRILH